MKKLATFTVGLLLLMSVLVNCSAAAPVRYNNHYYDKITVSCGILWNDARTQAETKYYYGFKGHLATITTQDESNFIAAKFPAAGYALGGYQTSHSQEPAGGWKWVTDETWKFTSWAPEEPNNVNGGEDILMTWDPKGRWNDGTRNLVSGYIIEYEPMPCLSSPPICPPGEKPFCMQGDWKCIPWCPQPKPVCKNGIQPICNDGRWRCGPNP
jgi:hypothetical protein